MRLSLAHWRISGRMRKEEKEKEVERERETLNVLGKDRKIHFIACLFSSCCPFTNLSSIATHLLASLSLFRKDQLKVILSQGFEPLLMC